MRLFGGMRVSASALQAERLRMNIIAENIANAETTRTPEGGAYRRRQVILATVAAKRGTAGAGVEVVAVRDDPTPGPLVPDPTHPDANAEGYVQMPNVSLPNEMVDMMVATRAYEANAQALRAQRQSQERSLELSG